VWWRVVFGFRFVFGGFAFAGPPAPPGTGALLLEDGVSYLLLEDAASKLLLQ
jgi:hypothetical protein